MIITHMSGGFGNQMYAFACGYALAKRKGEEFLIDTALQDEKWFFRNPEILKLNIEYDKRISYPIKKDFIHRLLLNKLVFRKNIGFKTPIVDEYNISGDEKDKLNYLMKIKGNMYLKGNWGNELYFSDYEDDIRKMFTMKYDMSDVALTILDQMKSSDQSVSIHIRRGDYVKIGCAIKSDYYIRAIERIVEELKNKGIENPPVFYVFSEDLEWAGQIFKQLNYKFVYADYKSENKDVEDLFLLSSAKHMIASNSSYSWWAAYLNANPDKIIILPYNKNTCWNEKFSLKNGIQIDFQQEEKSV